MRSLPAAVQALDKPAPPNRAATGVEWINFIARRGRKTFRRRGLGRLGDEYRNGVVNISQFIFFLLSCC